MTQFLEKHNITYWPSPAESPDLNPTEAMWSSLKSFLQYEEPKNEDELLAAIKTMWSWMTAKSCQCYIDHLEKAVPEVINNSGRAASGHST